MAARMLPQVLARCLTILHSRGVKKIGLMAFLVACNGPATTTRSAYDIVYVDDLSVPPGARTIDGLVLVVNRGSGPLDLSTAGVVSFSPPEVAFIKSGDSRGELPVGHAAGFLVGDAERRFALDHLTLVPVDDHELDFVLAFMEPPPDGIVRAYALVRIGGTDTALSFKIHVMQGDVVFNHSLTAEARF